MPNNRISANEPGLSAVLAHAAELQTEAMHLRSLLSAVLYLDNESACASERTSMLMLAERMADRLESALDSVHIGRAAA